MGFAALSRPLQLLAVMTRPWALATAQPPHTQKTAAAAWLRRRTRGRLMVMWCVGQMGPICLRLSELDPCA